MGHSLLAHLQDVSIRSVILAAVAAAALGVLRGKRGAAFGHAVWTVVLAGMLLLLALGPILPPLPLRVLPAAPAAPVSLPGTGWGAVAGILYALVALAFLLRLLVGSLLLRKLVRTSRAIGDARLTRSHGPILYESAAIAVPLTAGWARPKILLPSGWQAWDKPKLEAVLAHEASHVRRHDSLVALMAAVNRSLFWFHPLAWWMERKLALLAEQACDDACLRAIGDRDRYARLLLEMAGAVETAKGRVLRCALSMAKPSHMERRIEIILDGGRGPGQSLTGAAWAAMLLCSIPLIYTAAAVRLEPQPALDPLPYRAFAPPSPPAAFVSHVPQALALPRHKNQAEDELAAAVQRETDPRRKLALLNSWTERYPHSSSALERLQLYLNTYSQLNDVPNLLTALNQMGKEASLKALRINPGRAETDFSPRANVSQALFYYARAATYEGPGLLAVQGRQQLDEFLRKAYSSYYGTNDVGVNELKNLAKSMPFPPQAFLISVLPPPNKTFVSTLAAETSSIHIRNQCPYGLRIDCNGPERKRTWIPSGQDSQLVVAPGMYQIYAADARGVSSFTGPGRFDPQFDYRYTLSLKPD